VRVLGAAAADHFEFEALHPAACAPAPWGCGKVATAVATGDGAAVTVTISGTSPVEMAAALAHYCRTYLHMQFAWQKSGGFQTRMPEGPLPLLEAPITVQRRCAAGQRRCYSYMMNVCTLSYVSPRQPRWLILALLVPAPRPAPPMTAAVRTCAHSCGARMC